MKESSNRPFIGRLRKGAQWPIVLTCTLFGGCIDQRIHDVAQDQLRSGKYEQAVETVRIGAQKHPHSNLLRATLVEVRLDATTRLVDQALNAQGVGHLESAEALLRRALAISPEDPRARELFEGLAIVRRQQAALLEAQDLLKQNKPAAAQRLVNEALKANPRQPELVALRRRLEAGQRQLEIKNAQRGIEETRPISLDFKDASLGNVLDVVSRNSGLNFVLDKDIKPETRVTVFLRAVRVQDAIDLIASSNHLATKLLDSKTVLIYPDTPEKQREHQEQLLRVFYLSNGDPKGAAAMLKSVLKIHDPYIDEKSNMLVVHESLNNVQLAERLISLYDSGQAEVLLEMDVIELNSTRLTELGVQLPNSFSLSILPPATVGGSSSAPGSSGLTLANIRPLTLDRIGLSIGGVTVNLNRTTGDFNTLANPRIRVINREKAHVLIGDKIPIITTTQGATGFVSENVSYVDVGLKLDVEPTVYIDDDVGIKIALEVSTLGAQTTTTSGTVAYQISTRDASTVLRLHDGETQLLAGLINTQSSTSSTKLPILGDIPLAGRLLSNKTDSGQRDELVLSITPHVLRNVRQPDAAESEQWIGTEESPRLRPAGAMALEATQNAPGAEQPSSQSPLPGTMSPARDSSVLREVAPAQEIGPSPIHWIGPTKVKVNDVFEESLELETDQPVRGVPIQLAYSRQQLELLDIREGEFLRQGEAQTSFTKTIDQSNGQASAEILRSAPSGANGRGTLITLRLRAHVAGDANLSILSLQPIGLAGPVTSASVQPTLHLQIE